MSELIELFSPIQILFQTLRSLVDSFTFEISGSAIINDLSKIDYSIKKFKNQLFNQINKINIEFGNYENSINNFDFVKIYEKSQHTISNLTNSYDKIKENNIVLIKENQDLINQLQNLKNKLKSTNDEISLKDCIIMELKETLEEYQTKCCNNKIQSEKSILYQTDEINFLKEAIDFKEKENHSLTKDLLESDKRFNNINKDLLVTKALLRQCEEELKEYQIEIDRYKTLEKVDKKNMGNLKVNLSEIKGENKRKETQLKIDYELINSLKNEVVNLHQNIKDFTHQKELLSSELEKEQNENKNRSIEIENLCVNFDEMNDLLNKLTEKNCLIKKKKKQLRKDLEKTRIELMELKNELNKEKSDHEETKSKFGKADKELECLKISFESLNKDFKESQKKVQILNTVKSISEEKIKLLKQFITDFRVTELQFKNSIIVENKENQQKIELMRQAYQKLF